jgi:hypothetical protein
MREKIGTILVAIILSVLASVSVTAYLDHHDKQKKEYRLTHETRIGEKMQDVKTFLQSAKMDYDTQGNTILVYLKDTKPHHLLPGEKITGILTFDDSGKLTSTKVNLEYSSL